jgi:putative MFS transporter
MSIRLDRNTQLTVLIAAVGYGVDLFDTFLLPALRVPMLKNLGVADTASLSVYTTVFNWQLAGMFFGALLLWGPLADLSGRRKILLGSILTYGIGSLLTAAVQDVQQLSIIRFLAGIGLGGELGAGVTLMAENVTRQQRSQGAMLIGCAGMLGVVGAALLAKTSLDWRTIYVLGGLLAFGVLAIRIRISESRLFLRAARPRQPAPTSPTYGVLLRALLAPRTFLKLIACVLVGAPTFFVTGFIVPGAPEFAAAFHMQTLPSPTTALIWTYLSIAIGDVLCGALSLRLRSRKRALLVFHGITLFGIALLVLLPPSTPEGFYVRCAVAGLGIGFWANMVTNAAEQFGTDLRATATIVVPTAVRLLLFPISAAILYMKPTVGLIQATTIVGLITSVTAIIATSVLRDGFSVDLDFKELPAHEPLTDSPSVTARPRTQGDTP